MAQINSNPAITEQDLRIDSWINSQLVVPPSPQAASLGQYGEATVSKYTGSLEFSIPVYNLQGMNIQMPISLQYSGGANKVADLPSWVGLGWNLQTGGVITRSTQGDPDFEHNYYQFVTEMKSMLNLRDQFAKYDLMERALRMEIETQPDIYYYNFPGESGKFYIIPIGEGVNRRDTIISKDGSHLKFERFDKWDGDTEWFRITDNMGTVYEFKAVETTYYHTDDSADGRGGLPPRRFTYNSSWHLTLISNSFSGESITLLYSTETTPYHPPSVGVGYNSYTYPTSTSLVNGQYPCGDPNTPKASLGAPYSLLEIRNRRFLGKVILKRNLQSIETLTFKTTSYNRTWPGDNFSYRNRRLDKIEIQYYGNTETVETHRFEYFCPSGESGCQTQDAGRLTLKRYISPSHINSKGYEFTYNETPLPGPGSLKIDHWGYFNKNSRNNLAPITDIGGRTLYAGGANRESDRYLIMAGILERITYPTGGYTNVLWEPHKVQDWHRGKTITAETIGGGVRVKTLTHYSQDNVQASRYTYEYTAANSSYTSALLHAIPNYERYERVETSYAPQLGGGGGSDGGGGPSPCTGCGGQEKSKRESKSATGDSECQFVTISSTSMSPLGAVKGSFVGYSRVVEKNAGSTVYNFVNKKQRTSTVDEYENGELLLVEQFDNLGNRIATTSNTYDYLNRDQVEYNWLSIKVDPQLFQSDKYLVQRSLDGATYPVYEWVAPYERTRPENVKNRLIKSRLQVRGKSIQCKRRSLVSSTTTQYFYNSANTKIGEIAHTKEYQYNDFRVNKPTSISFTDSDGTKYGTEFQYASTCNLTQFTYKHAYAVPCHTAYTKNGVSLYRQELDYGGSSQVKFVRDAFHNNPLRLRETVELRDAQQNLLQTKHLTDESNANIFGLSGTVLLASVKNAKHNEIAFTSFEDSELGNWKGTNITINNRPDDVDQNPELIMAKAGYFAAFSGELSKSGLDAGKYILSYYTLTPGSIAVSGASVVNTNVSDKDAEGWYFVERIISVGQGSTLKVRIGAGCDEVRLYPADAMMTTYTYGRDRRLLVATGDERGIINKYEYDDGRRLRGVRDFEDNYLQYINYHFKQSEADYNSVSVKGFLTAGIKNLSQVESASYQTASWQKNFVDGLGRPWQSVQVKESPTVKDMVVPFAYDAYGRKVRDYIPYSASSLSGGFHTNALSAQTSYHKIKYGASNGAYAYTQSIQEVSPLSRQIASKLAGSDHQTKGTKITYRSNLANEVRDIRISAKFYPANSLLVVETTDPDGKVSREYVSKRGKVIRSDQDQAKTYFIYDDLGNNIQTIPPEAAKLVHLNSSLTSNSSQIKNNSFQNFFSSQTNLLSSYRRPGESASRTYQYYDRLERLVLIKYPDNKKVFTKYDILGREIMTGTYTGTALPAGSNALYENKSTGKYKYTTNLAFPTSGLGIYTVTYYDDYDYDGNGTEDAGVAYQAPPGSHTSFYPAKSSIRTRGMVTGDYIAVINASGSINSKPHVSSTFYDDRGRVLQTNKTHYLDGRDVTWMSYDFSGNLLRSRRVHSKNPSWGSQGSVVVNLRYTYDHRGRQINAFHQIGDNGQEVRLSQSAYSELGELQTKKIADPSKSGDYAQSIDFQYNINGWLTGINPGVSGNISASTTNDLFSMRLRYAESDLWTYETGPMYNGNISVLSWRTVGDSGAEAFYRLWYDKQNRLTSAYYNEKVPSHEKPYFKYQNTNNYSVSITSYDLNGNIKNLTRRGKRADGSIGFIDNLTYRYDGTYFDRMVGVTESADRATGFLAVDGTEQSFSYDALGRLASQENKRISSIQYDIHSLPRSFSLPNSQKFYVAYDGTGKKIVATPSDNSRRMDYVDGIEILNGEFYSIAHDEGRVVYENGQWVYEYVITDHLGNTRVLFRRGSGTSLDVRDTYTYYPFGMQNDALSRSGAGEYAYRYNGMERNDELGLDLAPFRSYDPAIGRWLQVDPLAELMPSMTPYRFGFNNPILWSDPWGLFESRKEARRFRREHGLGGRIKRTSKDADGNKTFAFTDRDSGVEYTYGAGSAGNFSSDAAFPTIDVIVGGESFKIRYPKTGSISQLEPNAAARFRDINTITGAIYDVGNDAAILAQALNPLQTNVRHLSGDYANQSEIDMSLVNTVVTALPQAKGLKSVQSLQGPGATIVRNVKLKEVHQVLLRVTNTFWHPKITALITRQINRAGAYINRSAEKTLMKKALGEAKDLSGN